MTPGRAVHATAAQEASSYRTGAMQQIVAAHPAVAECAVIGVDDPIKGQVPRAFVVLKAGTSAETLREDLIELVRRQIGANATLAAVDSQATARALRRALGSQHARASVTLRQPHTGS